jgi:hypothetical protein
MKETKVGFSLKNIKTEQFALIESVFKVNQPIGLNIGFNFGINEEARWIGCFANIQFLIDDCPFIILVVGCEFEIESKAWSSFIDKKNNKLTIPEGFLSHLAVITIGTTRGVLHAKTENTSFNKYHLPTVNINDFISKPITFDLETTK